MRSQTEDLAGGHRIAFGFSPAFTWADSSATTNVLVRHGLDFTPIHIFTQNTRNEFEARTPWLIVAHTITATTFTLTFATKNDGVIGAFLVPAGICSWMAVG